MEALTVLLVLVACVVAFLGARRMHQESLKQRKPRRNSGLHKQLGGLTTLFAISALIVALYVTYQEATKPVFLVPLDGVAIVGGALCANPGCDRPATMVTPQIANALKTTGRYQYSGKLTGAYCDKHHPTQWDDDLSSGLFTLLIMFLVLWGGMILGFRILHSGVIAIHELFRRTDPLKKG